MKRTARVAKKRMGWFALAMVRSTFKSLLVRFLMFLILAGSGLALVRYMETLK